MRRRCPVAGAPTHSLLFVVGCSGVNQIAAGYAAATMVTARLADVSTATVVSGRIGRLG